jgi:adenosylcobinamide kinase/adenosylcobinamide-phosphate guanylyltransferase
VEAPLALISALRSVPPRIDAVLVDCLTLWVANLQLRGQADEAILAEADALATLIAEAAYELTLVSNEVGQGVHPPTAEGLRFRDLLGLVNQRVAAACAHVTLMVAGLPLTVKAPAPRHDVGTQAP